MAALLLPGLTGCATVEDAPAGEAAYAIVPPPPAVGMDYRLSPEDVLRIQVYHEPGLSLEDAQVTAAGMVRMPLIGDVPVAGLTAGEAADVIAGRLGERYLVSPQVTLFVKKAVGRRITLDGEVREPGLYPIEGRLTLSQAVALAKGPTRLASLGQVVVVRRMDGERRAAMFDLAAIRKGEAPDPEILPGDQLIVGLSRAKAILGGALIAVPAIAAGFIALDGDR
ncbi:MULTISPECIES: polysaccharide biosynthesis/export family protein [unclassified Sphingobium]|jgi:polysaccharide export outer membrane protein|uniref:polysaccharide biosynthesis/export family protein n=1 Tax=unclassified Sphingobium TaxID=2611147 RepID=UPI001E4833CA|nr:MULTISPECIES: polysaccharide biosynthesis/export family protein [unclassified Sphingobium]WIW89958.1 polysaccharide biosynthesis/export family protein [Sphingobium sp. V4]